MKIQAKQHKLAVWIDIEKVECRETEGCEQKCEICGYPPTSTIKKPAQLVMDNQ